MVKTVTQDGATVKVTAEEISDSEEGDDDNVYNVKVNFQPQPLVDFSAKLFFQLNFFLVHCSV